MYGLGTEEPFVGENLTVAMHWRKPLRLGEINRMAPTAEVKQRPGRA